jgi:hypothetical protein
LTISRIELPPPRALPLEHGPPPEAHPNQAQQPWEAAPCGRRQEGQAHSGIDPPTTGPLQEPDDAPTRPVRAQRSPLAEAGQPPEATLMVEAAALLVCLVVIFLVLVGVPRPRR